MKKKRVFRIVKRYASIPRAYNYRVDERHHFFFIPYWLEAHLYHDGYESCYFRSLEEAIAVVRKEVHNSKIKYIRIPVED